MSVFCTFAKSHEDSLATAQSAARKPYTFYLFPQKRLMATNIGQDPKGMGDDVGVPISFSGAFRFNAMYRSLSASYPNVKPQSLNIGGFGDGSIPFGGSPLLTLVSKITPAEGVELGIGMGFSHILSGSSDPDSTRSRLPFGQTFGGTATFTTNYGKIKVGGGNLYTGMSQMLSGWAQVRWNPFYRLPWDASPQWGGAWSTYENTFTNGSVTNFDAAYANGGRTQGAIVQLSDLPGGFGLNMTYGVDGQTGLYLPSTSDTANSVKYTKKTIGGRAYKKAGAHTFGITGILNNGFVDNVSDFRETQYMYSVDAHIVLKNVSISSEFGATAFSNPFGPYEGNRAGNGRPWDTIQYNSGVDFLGEIKLKFKKEAFGLPTSITLYNLGANYINANSGAFNTSTYNNTAAYMQINSTWDVATRKGFIADLGQSANNRRAFEVTTQIDKGRFKVSLGTQVGTEIKKADSASVNQVMFYHKLNPWSRAGFNYWTPQGGAYHRLLGNFIQLLERVSITDQVIDYKKTFNVFDVEARYKTTFLGRPTIFTSYTSYQSAADKWSPLPFVSNKAFVRSLYEELLGYYQLKKDLVLAVSYTHLTLPTIA